MNFKKTTLALALTGAMAAPFASADLKIGGKLDVLVETGDNSSLDVRADDVELYFTAVEQVGSVKWIADIDLEFAGLAEDNGTTTIDTSGATTTDNTVEVDAARIIAVGSFGAFVVGQSPSGIFADIYAKADIMAENTDVFSAQDTQFNNAIAWKTPNFGPVYAVLASYSDGGDGDGTVGEKDIDIAVARVVYKANGIQAGYVMLDFQNDAATVDTRQAFGASYTNDMFTVAGFFEVVAYPDTGRDDQEVMGLSALYNATDKLALKVSYEEIEGESVGLVAFDNDVTAVGFDYAISKNITLYGETANYDADCGATAAPGNLCDSNTVVGTKFQF
ncbi:MAG: hypothetical protein ACJA04_001213 [Cellvibrionaceae bacterium]|jgi:hypothetical protein